MSLPYSWEVLLKNLAEKAVPEKWDFPGAHYDKPSKYPILSSYFIQTFRHLRLEDKILVSRRHNIAAFNTGLVDKYYRPIYACFKESDNLVTPWVFCEFCCAGETGMGKILVAAFNPLPPRAVYIKDVTDFLMDTNQPVYINFEHMILDNISRLPMKLLMDEVSSDDKARVILEKLAKCQTPKEKSDLFNQLREVLDSPMNSKLLRNLKKRLEDAKDLAIMRADWNYRTAVPSYFPTRDKMNILLPLDLTDDGMADVALVVERTDSGAYQGQTILTMEMAYNNARLICKPESDWLCNTIQAAK